MEKTSKLNLLHKILPKKISQNILWWEKREIYSVSHNSTENNVLSLIHIYNIIKADREKEKSICNQGLPLQTNVLNASILSVYLENVLSVLQKNFQIRDIFLIHLCWKKKTTLYFKAVPAHTINKLWCLRVDGKWWKGRIEFWFLL